MALGSEFSRKISVVEIIVIDRLLISSHVWAGRCCPQCWSPGPKKLANIGLVHNNTNDNISFCGVIAIVDMTNSRNIALDKVGLYRVASPAFC